MFVQSVNGLDGSRCIIHGSKIDIDDDDSCGFWVDWPTKDGKPIPEVVANHASELSDGLAGSVTPEESGLVDELVQCRHCVFSTEGARVCGLYRDTNRAMPQTFALDEKIQPNACCNAWTEIPDADDAKEASGPMPKRMNMIIGGDAPMLQDLHKLARSKNSRRGA